MSNDMSAAVPDDPRWLAGVGRILANLGFELVEPDRPQGDETSHLLAALRPKPTLQHYDPESIDYWTTDGSRGRAAALDRETRFPVVADFAWGRITLTDRVGVKNEFLSFGGTMRAQMTDDTTVLIDFSSNAPILRWSGHSQSTDPLAAEVGAFFARVKVPIDFVPGAEGLVSRATPQTFYCAVRAGAFERGPHPARSQPLAGGVELPREPAHGVHRERPLAGGRRAAAAAGRDRDDRSRVGSRQSAPGRSISRGRRWRP
jgi:hypothetical protein